MVVVSFLWNLPVRQNNDPGIETNSVMNTGVTDYQPSSPFTRRHFLRVAGVAWAAVHFIPARVFGANSRLSLAGVGVGGVGFPQLRDCEKAGFQIAALCDVDDVYAKKAFDKWPQARRYRDFREMLRAEGDKIDAVYCGTPDHTHAVITLAALRRKKHVCCVKPLTRTIHENRVVVEAARKTGVATQVTAQANTSDSACRTCELIAAGAIGAVREVHVWSNRPLWPQGMTRPTGEDPVPASFDWKLWLGPAPLRPFKDKWPDGSYALEQVKAAGKNGPHSKGVYHPWNFRGWWDFGTGALGDMGCHYLNTPFRALKLTHPIRVQASSTKVFAETAPLAAMVTYEFPARGEMPPVRVTWYDGGLKPPALSLFNDRPPDGGALYFGDEAWLLGSTILPRSRAARAESVPKTLPRRGGTWVEWFEACKGGEAAGCNFDWTGPLTEAVLLGNIAIRAGKPLEWDAARAKFTNDEAANALVSEAYQNGWSLDAV
jgi:predicted dehydrogenase